MAGLPSFAILLGVGCVVWQVLQTAIGETGYLIIALGLVAAFVPVLVAFFAPDRDDLNLDAASRIGQSFSESYPVLTEDLYFKMQAQQSAGLGTLRPQADQAGNATPGRPTTC